MTELTAIKNELQLLQELAEAEEDIRNNRVAPVETMFTNMRKVLQELASANILIK